MKQKITFALLAGLLLLAACGTQPQVTETPAAQPPAATFGAHTPDNFATPSSLDPNATAVSGYATPSALESTPTAEFSLVWPETPEMYESNGSYALLKGGNPSIVIVTRPDKEVFHYFGVPKSVLETEHDIAPIVDNEPIWKMYWVNVSQGEIVIADSPALEKVWIENDEMFTCTVCSGGSIVYEHVPTSSYNDFLAEQLDKAEKGDKEAEYIADMLLFWHKASELGALDNSKACFYSGAFTVSGTQSGRLFPCRSGINLTPVPTP